MFDRRRVRGHYNQLRPHSALGYRTPIEFATEIFQLSLVDKSGARHNELGDEIETPLDQVQFAARVGAFDDARRSVDSLSDQELSDLPAFLASLKNEPAK